MFITNLKKYFIMKTIGLLGGMSLESTIEYVRIIKDGIAKATNGTHSAKIIMTTVDFAEVEKLQHEGKWKELTDMLCYETLNLVNADILLMCTNTMHVSVPEIEKCCGMEFLHIADVTAEAIKAQGLSRVALLGTKFTMEEDFYVDRLRAHDIEAVIPCDEDRDYIHGVIYNELCKNIISDTSKRCFMNIISWLKERGAEGVVLACTEIPLLIRQEDMIDELDGFPVFDTTRLHAEVAVKIVLKT